MNMTENDIEELFFIDKKEFTFIILGKNIILNVTKLNDYLYKTNIIENNFSNVVNVNNLIYYLKHNRFYLLEVK